MKAVDLNRVAGLQALDAEGNVLGMVSMEEITDSVAARIADAISSDKTLLPAASRPRAAAATGSDKMENALGETTDPAYVRVIDKSGNSARQSIQSLAQVAGGLIGNASLNNDGLMPSYRTLSVLYSGAGGYVRISLNSGVNIAYGIFFTALKNHESAEGNSVIYLTGFNVDSRATIIKRGSYIAGISRKGMDVYVRLLPYVSLSTILFATSDPNIKYTAELTDETPSDAVNIPLS